MPATMSFSLNGDEYKLVITPKVNRDGTVTTRFEAAKMIDGKESKLGSGVARQKSNGLLDLAVKGDQISIGNAGIKSRSNDLDFVFSSKIVEQND